MPLLPLYVYVIVEETQSGKEIVAVANTKKKADELKAELIRTKVPEKAELWKKVPILARARFRIEEHQVQR